MDQYQTRQVLYSHFVSQHHPLRPMRYYRTSMGEIQAASGAACINRNKTRQRVIHPRANGYVPPPNSCMGIQQAEYPANASHRSNPQSRSFTSHQADSLTHSSFAILSISCGIAPITSLTGRTPIPPNSMLRNFL